jgi:hypothetical protein
MWWWAVGMWTVAVAAGGALTLWLQESAEPPPPTGWYRSDQGGGETPAPLLSADVSEPPCPSATDDGTLLCAYATIRQVGPPTDPWGRLPVPGSRPVRQ